MDLTAKWSINELVERMHLIRDREEIELRKFCENPTQLDFAWMLTDRYWRCLLHLCNYDHTVDGNGIKYEITEVIQSIDDLMSKEFKKATGHEYVPTGVRYHIYSRENQPTLSQQLKEED